MYLALSGAPTMASISSMSLSYSGLLYRVHAMMFGHFVPTGVANLLCRSLSVLYGSEMLPQWTKKMVSDWPVAISSFHAVELSGSTCAVASKPALLSCSASGGASGAKNCGPRTGTFSVWPSLAHMPLASLA